MNVPTTRNTILQLKMFSANSLENIERLINKWLSENYEAGVSTLPTHHVQVECSSIHCDSGHYIKSIWWRYVPKYY